MKSFLISFFILMTVVSFSQQAEPIKISHEQIKNSKSVKEIFKGFPEDCKILSYSLSVTVNGSLRTFECRGETISTNIKEVILNSKNEKTFFIENIKSKCPHKYSHSYNFIITE